MGIEEFARWYQKKIGTYDKQQWEKTVEEKILHDLTHVHTKTAKPKTEYIDLDLIRGSSFPKAKPKHGLFVVSRLSIQRLLFYPFYGKWWIQQTSSYIFKLFLLFYFLQLIKIFLYFCHWKEKDKGVKSGSANLSSASPECDIIIPMLIMLVMSFIHSVIVSTNPEQEKRSQRNKVKRKRRKVFNSKMHSDDSIKYARHEKIKKKIPNNFIRRNKINAQQSNKKTLDEGFESFNGNGSSENGDEKRNEIENGSGIVPERNIVIKNIVEENNLNLKKIEMKESISDVGETDTDSEPQSEMIIRRRLPKINVTSETDTDSDTQLTFKSVASLSSRRGSMMEKSEESSCFESDDGNEDVPNGGKLSPQSNCIDESVSATEWMGVTTNSEDCSYSSEHMATDSQNEMNNNQNEQPFWDNDFGPTNILSPSCAPSDLVSCTIWKKNDMKKADLSVLDISSAIIGRGESIPDSLDYFYFCIFFSCVLSTIPVLIRIKEHAESLVQGEDLSMVDISFRVVEQIESFGVLIDIAFSSILWEKFVMTIAIMERFFLAMIFFFQLAVAERTFKQRFLYAKLFCHLTSSRKARKSDLPHFRLNKVRNIKTWLSVRSYLKKRGPQRSVDVIVSTSFIVTLLLLSFVSIELVKNACELNTQYSIEALFWGLFLGVYLLRFMTLGTKIHSKYRNLSVLITEQINLYLQIEQKPHKKDELMVANSVLKLASDLLKELESPFKISGLSANPYLYTITKLVILSALSGVFSEMLGFKLKLHKLKIK